ncbi:sn-glycerol-3-phosphate ABC transporter ATP-binding protein UgpC [Parasalinivibrio latis]|uniref:ABC transporter ATP-binding protein n=1 Tax=Parasalinivibrio latis TaxID=2952610 RepID=UPI0030E242BF
MTTIQYQQVSKNFADTKVLKSVDLEIGDGEFVVLLGPSGCGKSTLLRLTAGLEEITSGSIVINGERMNNVHPRDRDIAMVFQNYALYPLMTVYDNMAFALRIKKLSEDAIREKIEWSAEILNLTGYLDHFPRQLSGGQRQRVAMGRAIVRDPSAFLFDEPLSNLDAKLRAALRHEIRALHDKLKTTTVYVTHDQVEAMTMADKIVLMRDGRIEQIGTADEVFEKPRTEFVADFIGSPAINLFDGVICIHESRMVCRCEGALFPLPVGCRVKAGDKVRYGIRPDQITYSSTEDDGEILGRVEDIESTGVQSLLYININGLVVRVNVPRKVSTTLGSECSLTFQPDAIHLFDSESRRRIDSEPLPLKTVTMS